MEPLHFKGKRALILGVADDIGKHAAMALAGAGADVAIVDENNEKAIRIGKMLRQKFGIRSVALHARIASPREVCEAVEYAAAALGGIDIALNVIGRRYASAKDWLFENRGFLCEDIFCSYFRPAKTIAKSMIARQTGGYIINLLSACGGISSSVTKPFITNDGLLQMTRAMADEWARYNIRLGLISYGAGYFSKEWTNRMPARQLGDKDRLLEILAGFANDVSQCTDGEDDFMDGSYFSGCINI